MRSGLVLSFVAASMLRGGLAFIARAGVRQAARVATPRSTPFPSQPFPSVPAFTARTHVRPMMSAAAGAGDNVKVRAAHILVKDQASADLLLKRLKGGEDFATLAQFESSCPSKAEGGDLGYFGRGQMVEPFEKFCFNNEPGTVGIAETQFGFHVIKVLERAKLPTDIYPQQLADILGDVANSDEWQLVDVREQQELELASIKGANFIHLPISGFQQWGPKVMADEFDGLDKAKKTVVLCHHGGRSMQVAAFFSTQAGFKDVYNVAGGIHQYALAVDSSIPTY